MGFETYFGTDPAEWICRGGAPAAAVGGWRGGLPSYEHEDGDIVIYDLQIMWPGTAISCPPLLLSAWYNSACILAPDGMVPLHHCYHEVTLGVYDPVDESGGAGTIREIQWLEEAWYSWRPCMYRLKVFEGWQMVGSQAELAWRKRLAHATHALHSGIGAEEQIDLLTEMDLADDKADRLLREHLNPQQRLELAVNDSFRTFGARTGNLYEISLGDGFGLLDKRTSEMVESYCLHTEHWLPTADIALATKLALEDPDLEVECLENARSYRRPGRVRASRAELHASELERKLLCA